MERDAGGHLGGGAGGFVEHGYVAHRRVGAGDLGEARVIGVGGDADELEVVGMGRDDAQGVFADGAGGAEQDDALRRRRRGCTHNNRQKTT